MHWDEIRRTIHRFLLVRVGRGIFLHDSSCSLGSWDLEFRIGIPGSRDLVQGMICRFSLLHRDPMPFQYPGEISFLGIAGWNGLLAWGERHKNKAYFEVLGASLFSEFGGIFL